MQDLAALTGLGLRHFARSFLKSAGQTPARYVHDKRIERARTLLFIPDLAMTEIALSCGFTHSQHFANSFRRAMGMSPSRYRRQLA